MNRSVQPDIVFAHLPRSEALEAAIRRRVAHLSSMADDLKSCRVVVEQIQRHAHQGRPFEIRVEVGLTGIDLVANRSRHEDAYVALRDAFDDMTRQMQEAVRRRRAGPHYRDTLRHAGPGFSAGASPEERAGEPGREAGPAPAPPT